MKYVRVDAIKQHADEPVLRYAELDDSCAEIRKVEIFPNGLAGWATPERANGRTKLATVHEVPAVEITREEFEWVWNRWVR
jgi:hypothetical protein